MIELRRLTIGFPGPDTGFQPAVRDVSLVISPGEKVGIVGESGSGKSLTALACLGLVPQPGRRVHGTVVIGGRDLGDIPAEDLLRWRGGTVGFSFQEASSALNPVYTVGFQLEEAIRCHSGLDRSQSKVKARDLLAALAVEPVDRILASYPHQLSGGQAQRIMLAIALAGDPSLLIADEPTSALDSVTKKELLRLIEELVAERGLGLLLISHDLEVVRDTVDRVAVMYAGEIVEEATTEIVFGDPLHPYTRLLLASTPGSRNGTRRRTAPAAPRSMGARSNACAFASRCAIARPSCRSSRPELIELALGRRLRCPVTAEETAGDRVS